MANQLFDRQVRRCDYCLHGTLSAEKDSVICEKRGVTERDGSCRSFRYDPLAREPEKQRELPDYDPDSFRL